MENQPLEEDLRAFRDGQRDLLLNFVRRFEFHDEVDCGEAIGRENISAHILDGMPDSVSDSQLLRGSFVRAFSPNNNAFYASADTESIPSEHRPNDCCLKSAVKDLKNS